MPDAILQYLPYVVAIILGIVVFLVLLFALLYAQAPQLGPLISYLHGKDRRKCLPPSLAASADEAAAERRSFLSRFLDISDPVEFPQFEIRETPPGTEATSSRREFSPSDAVGQMVRVRWQIDRSELLLLERVVDTAISIVLRQLEDGDGRASSGLLGAIRLEPLRRSRARDFFPWTVILETNYPEVFRSDFERLQSWLAIGIDFDRPKEIIRYGLCHSPGGKLGEVGGLLTVQNESFAIPALMCFHIAAKAYLLEETQLHKGSNQTRR